jgi:phage-related minor tail protein
VIGLYASARRQRGFLTANQSQVHFLTNQPRQPHTNMSQDGGLTAALPIPIEAKTVDSLDVTAALESKPIELSTRGQNVSGRKWKVRLQKRASSLVTTRANNRTKDFAEAKLQQVRRKEVLELEKQIKEEKRQEALAAKQRRLDNEKRRAENELKAIQHSVQTLNHHKVGTTIKAMSKKQLRQIKKSRVNPQTGVVEYVSPWAK